MKVLILQERGRHEKNRDFREALCLKRSLERLGHDTTVWGLNYDNFTTSFDEISQNHDVLLSLENYDTGWHPSISNFKGLKAFWSIDSHCSLAMHIDHCKKSKYDLLLSSTRSYIDKYSGLVEYATWFPNAYPSDLIKPSENITREHSIGFCGSSITHRDRVLDIVSQNFNLKRDTFVIGKDMVNALSSYKIAFNMNISDDINYRTFESTGAGAMLITNYTPDLEHLFEIGKEIVAYSTIDEMIDKIKYYLDHDQERAQIADAGLKRSLRDHTYDERAKRFISIINDLRHT